MMALTVLKGEFKMSNILYVAQQYYDVILNLEKSTSIQRFHDRMIIHFQHPDESFTIFDDQEEFAIIEDYFNVQRHNRLRLTNFINKNENYVRNNEGQKQQEEYLDKE